MTSNDHTADWEDGIESDRLDKATVAVIKAFKRRIAAEMVAAWRADYAALDVVVDSGWPVPDDADPEDLLTVKASFTPSHRAGPPNPDCWPADANMTRYRVDYLTKPEAQRLYTAWKRDLDEPFTPAEPPDGDADDGPQDPSAGADG